MPSTIQGEISRIAQNVADSLTAVANKGVTVPTGSNSNDLAGLIGQISGGGGSDYTLLDSAEYTVNTSSTSATQVGTITITPPSDDWRDFILFIPVIDKAGPRSGYFYASFVWYMYLGKTSSTVYAGLLTKTSSGTIAGNSNAIYGVYCSQLTKSGSQIVVKISSRYNSTYSTTINGTYKAAVYAIKWPNNTSPFN